MMHEDVAGGMPIETAGLRIITYRGDEIDYSSGGNLREAIEDSSIVTEGQACGAVVAMLNISDFEDINRIQVDSPVGQSDLETVEQTIALLTEVRNALRVTVAV